MGSHPPPMSRSAGGPEFDALAALLGSARDLVGELAKGSTQRALRALAAIPPDERMAVTTALERAAETWRQSEAFAPLHNVRVRANPNAQLFVRIFDDVMPGVVKAMHFSLRKEFTKPFEKVRRETPVAHPPTEQHRLVAKFVEAFFNFEQSPITRVRRA